MAQPCSICSHPRRDEIDRAIVRGEANRRIAPRYGVSEKSIRRHIKNGHVSEKIAKAEQAREIAQADNLLGEIVALQRRTVSIADQAEASGDLRVAVSALREVRANLELLARLAGELDDRASVNIVISAEWQALRVVIMQALEQHPEARMQVAEALGEVDDA